MPTPLDILLDPVSLGIIGMYLLLMIWETVFPGRVLPAIKFWKLRGIAVFLFYFYLSSYLPLLWARWLPSAQLLDLSGIGSLVVHFLAYYCTSLAFIYGIVRCTRANGCGKCFIKCITARNAWILLARFFSVLWIWSVGRY